MAHDKVYGICESKCFVPLNFFYGFTFVIDSDEKLNQWANNQEGNDYTSVLIKKGTWTSSVGVNLSTCGTKVVVGEAGSKLNFKFVEYSLYYKEVPTSPEYYMFGVEVSCLNSSDSATAFYKCANLTNCIGTANCIKHSYGFQNCANLTNCRGAGIDSNNISASKGYGFYNCTGVSKCKPSEKSKSFVFQNCYASQSETETYACADTPEGGFNYTLNNIL